MQIDENFINKLKSLCEISAIVSNYAETKVCGSNLRCCCPFHVEKTPSFFIYKSTQSFYCYGCGVGGDVITFIEKIENLSYIEAIKFLSSIAKIEFPNITLNKNLIFKKSTIIEINKLAATFFYHNLFSEKGRPALTYLKNRGLNLSILTKFGLGYSLNEWDSLFNFLKKKGYSNNDIIQSGLVFKNRLNSLCDKFRNRIMFPIIGVNKKEVVGFGGRIIPNQSKENNSSKYLNSAENEVFKKGYELYGLNFLNKAKVSKLILCEGYMDVIAMHQAGFCNVVATLGTALTLKQVSLISRITDEVVIAFDSDEAGQIASLRACEMFQQTNLKIKILKLAQSKDLAEYLQKFGASNLKTLIDDAISFEKFIFNDLEQDVNVLTIEKKQEIIKKICDKLSKINDILKRELYVNKLCSKFSINRDIILNYIKKITKKVKNKRNFLKNGEHFESVINFKKNMAEELILKFIFQNGCFNDEVTFIIENLSEKNFDVELYRRIFIFLTNQLKSGQEISFLKMREILNSGELSVFSKIVNNENFLNLKYDDCVKILKDSYLNTREFVLNMDNFDLEKKRRQKAEEKQ